MAPEPAWIPNPTVVDNSNLSWLIDVAGVDSYQQLHEWSISDRPGFWQTCIVRLAIVFDTPATAILAGSAQDADWLPGARMNIAASALDGPADQLAVIHGTAGSLHRVTFEELRRDVGRCSNGMRARGIGPGDAVAIVMPMTYEAVVAYLGIVALGGVVVSIADSFAAEEIATRVGLANATWAVTQHASIRAGKTLPMYEKVVAAGVPRAIVVAGAAGPALRDSDVWWDDLLSDDAALRFHIAEAADPTNILFSSGTTGEPKAIPWTHLTPIKGAMDGHFHQDIQPGDVVAWPTNLGWMMGPWLIYAALINDAAVALCTDAPTGEEFVHFVEEAAVTMLGVVPSLVAAWRAGDLLSGVDWSAIRTFSSTGEASSPDDMEYLMAAPGGRPVIEYCGGTEIGGGYVTGTVLQPAIAGTFTTPALGLDLLLVDEGAIAEEGEVFLVPPSIGLSTTLLNRDHAAIYYHDLPDLGMPLRRHGDHMERLPNGYWRALGRVDDTMNLGGIKVSSAELERAASGIAGVSEIAAVAVPPVGGGPERLVIYAVPDPGVELDPEALRTEMQAAIRRHLNPLFKVEEVVVIEMLPRTASAKVMRRNLRTAYGVEPMR
jgi:acetyl-CoA synthetase